VSLTLGVFDSGFGGLTVLRAMLPLFPGTRCLYLGDTARLPYGSKSRETIARYAVSATQFLQDQGADYLVIACNTASALAIDEIRASASVPVLGVIETGAAAAAEVSVTKSAIVLATSATIDSHAYVAACAELGVHAQEKACPLLVPLVEEGWAEHAVADQVVRIYLDEALAAAKAATTQPDTLLLGCTHYPLLRPLFERHVPKGMRIVDSADVTAARAAEILAEKIPVSSAPATCEFFVTDSVARFEHLGHRFLGRPVTGVTHVDLGD
jgi:glutamate racemase